MTELTKYKHLVAVVLLVLYAFITTPVQFWHHHNNAATSIYSLPSDDAANVAASYEDNKTIEDSCQICGHHYSIYSTTDVFHFKIITSVINPKQGFYAFATPFAPYFHSANKGPPTIA